MRNYKRRSRRSKSEARTFRPNQFLAKWHEVEQEHSQIGQAVTEQTKQLSANAVDFFEQILGFKPYAYQKEFAELFENNQFTAARWCRQSGKTETISALLLKYAVTHPNAAICVVGPSWRQTKRIITRILAFAHKLPPGIVFKPQKTQIHFVNGSSIEAFPNNPETIRGPTFDVVYCLPSGVKVNLENGTQIPIEQIKPGQSVLSYNFKTSEVEPKRVVRTFKNPRAGRTIMRISHSFGALDCTAEHKIFSLTRGFVDASRLMPDDKILYLAGISTDKTGETNKTSSFHQTYRNPKAINLRRTFRRSLYPNTCKLKKKRTPCCESFFQASGLRAIQVLYPKEHRKNTAKRNSQFRRVGKVPSKILYYNTSRNNRNLSHLLSFRCQNCNSTMVRSNKQSSCIGNMVYGRREYLKISSKFKHKQIYSKRTVASPAMAQKAMGYRGEDLGGQPRQRIFSAIERKKPRRFLQYYKATNHTVHAIQDSGFNRVCSLLYLRTTRSTKKSGLDSQETCDLFKQGMQKQISQTQPWLEGQREKALCNMQNGVYAHSTKNVCLFKIMLPPIQASIQKTQAITKQEAESRYAMLAVRETLHTAEWSSKNLQHRMSESKKTFVSTEVQPKVESKLIDMRCQIKESNVSETLPQNVGTEEENYVYDIEVEDNHNFFAEGVLVSNCDEMNFVANDHELYDAILYTLGTTDGKFVCSSTPWNTDSVFYKIFTQKNFSHFKTSHVTYEKALSPNGPLKSNIIQRIKEQMGDDPSRWKREMEAEWVEGDNVWLSQSLIASCIGTEKNCSEKLDVFDSEISQNGEFFAGLDLAQTRDYTVFSVVERLNDRLFLRHLKIFSQPTMYAHVLGYIKALQDRWGGFERIRVDFTREGPSFISEMEAAGIDNAEGVNFSVPRKSEMASVLKHRMTDGRFYYPLLNWERPYRGDICSELNVERYEYRKDGTIGYSHPNGTHDDVFWSIALAVFASMQMEPEQFLTVVPRS